MFHFSFKSTATVAAVALLFSGAVQAQSAGPGHGGAQVTRAESGKALVATAGSPAHQAVAGYIASRGRSSAVVASLRSVQNRAGAHGVTHVRMEQIVDGLVVQGSYVKAAVNARGELTQVISKLAEVSTPAPSSIDAHTALRAAVARVHPSAGATFRQSGAAGNVATFQGGAFFHSPPTVTAVAIPRDSGLLRGWLVESWAARTNELYYTLVDGAGNVVDVEKRTASDRYFVFPEDPSKGPQSVINGPAPGGALSPSGWLGTGAQTTTNIRGNNVAAYLDVDSNNRVDRGGVAVANGDFLTSANLLQQPSTTANRAVAVQNLFYLSNVMHDILYTHGFNEAAGNFQVNNFGLGGAGADPVLAEAQDGGGLDNANFATPADGRSPRMQMYLWSGAGPTHEVALASGPVYGAKGAEFGPAMTSIGVTGPLSIMSPSDGCSASTGPLSGKVALIDRGSCAFTVKVLNAQNAGATAVVIANNTAGTFLMGGTDRAVRISSVMVSQADGAALKGASGTSAAVRKKAAQPLQIDGAVDSDIVFHEYGHGLTWRMIGGMSGPLAGAIGEGVSDGISMLVNGNPVVGEYSASSPNGIRRYRYDTYPLTYGNVTGAEVHDDGEIYGAIVWKMIELFGARRNELFRYVVDGMNYTPAAPAYEQMRDGILGSVLAGPAPADCSLVWQAFAQYGVGVGAQGTVNGSAVSITQSFAVPAACH